jgi:NPCBM/NEW2 domain
MIICPYFNADCEVAIVIVPKVFTSRSRFCQLVWAVLSICATLCSPLGAAEVTTAPVSSDPVFKAILSDGKTVSGRIDSFAEASISIAGVDGSKHELPFEQLIKLTRDSVGPIGDWEGSHQILLPDGDSLSRVNVLASTETALVVQSSILGKLLVPLTSPVGVILAPPRQTDALDLLRDQVLRDARTTEVLWMTNGDRVKGSFASLDNHEIKFQIDANAVGLDRSRVVALGFDPSLVVYPKPKNSFLEFTLTDGSRLGLSGVHLSEGHVQGKARFGEPIRFPLADLSRIYSRNMSVVYLSERSPAAVQYVPYIGPTRQLRVDQTVEGHPFQLAGESFDPGVGTQSRTLVAYRLEAGDRRFQSLVGVDERAGPLGSVVFRVLLDGKERFKSASMTEHEPPKSIDIDISGARTLILATEFGDRGDVRDLADWVEARIIR